MRLAKLVALGNRRSSRTRTGHAKISECLGHGQSRVVLGIGFVSAARSGEFVATACVHRSAAEILDGRSARSGRRVSAGRQRSTKTRLGSGIALSDRGGVTEASAADLFQDDRETGNKGG